jgi:hypothetical protein
LPRRASSGWPDFFTAGVCFLPTIVRLAVRLCWFKRFFPFAVLLVTTLSTAHGYMQIPPVAIHTYAIAIVSGRVSGAPGSIANAAAHPLRQDD